MQTIVQPLFRVEHPENDHHNCFQIGFGFHAGSLTVPSRAFTPYCTCESAMNATFSGLTSPANDAGNLALSSSK